MKRVDPRITSNARKLRNSATDPERAMWRILSRYRPRFTRQLPIGRYIVDLACREARVAIEFDGGQHVDNPADLARTEFLESEGWTVIRFWNSDVRENSEGVAEAIVAKVAECLGGTHPQPLPSREGRIRRQRS